MTVDDLLAYAAAIEPPPGTASPQTKARIVAALLREQSSPNGRRPLNTKKGEPEGSP